MAQTLTLQQALEAYLLSMAGVLSEATIDWYRKHIKCLVAALGPNLPIDMISISMLRNWRASLEHQEVRYADHPNRPALAGGLAPETLRSRVRAVRMFFLWLLVEGLLAENPAQRLEIPPRPRQPRKGISDDNMRKIIDVAGNGLTDRSLPTMLRDRALVMFLADTACRVGGLCALTLEDLDLDERTAQVREKGCGGHGLPRTVFFEADTAQALRNWLMARANLPGERRVFIGQRGALKSSGVYQLLARLAKAAGVPTNWNPQNWRHGAARAMLINGASLAHVQQILGHADVSTTAHFYATFSTRELQDAHDRYSWRGGQA